MVLGLHRMWGYTPEQAIEAPLWVLRMTDVLAYDASFDEKAS